MALSVAQVTTSAALLVSQCRIGGFKIGSPEVLFVADADGNYKDEEKTVESMTDDGTTRSGDLANWMLRAS